ncbi:MULTISPECIES: hypothetical protein [unclassified Bradyrhizobium]|uniref:hypothetical protein n=1 Tax=unclassified Bradyrhizobium TaxID=2631580 RepID=UPI0023B06EC9|nr:hypothetical protein [Bradyrhizobium sp. CSS354]
MTMIISPNFGAKLLVPTAAGKLSQNSPLVNYALNGLERCWLPEHRRWSHIYHLDGRSSPNESVPNSDVFYTLNVLLGMSRVAGIPSGIDLPEIFHRNVLLLTRLPVRKYAFGMALWSAAELGVEIPEPVKHQLRAILADESRWRAFRAQDLGMLLTGIVAQARAGENEWWRYAMPLYRFLKERLHSESGLFFDAPFGFRRRFSSFATQTYLSIACYQYGEFAGDASALVMADTCVRNLIALQGPQGEWPWFFDALNGRVLDFYEVYSVHQYGMAPALLEWAESFGLRGSRDALVKGFNWVLGQNQLGRAMLVPELNLTLRSQVRKGELTTRAPRVLRALKNAWLGKGPRLIEDTNVEVRLECRSYELGWILWSFGRRTDLQELTHNCAFGGA